MSYIYVAYNTFGDLVAEATTMHGLRDAVERAGYLWNEVLTGKVAP